MFLVIQHHLASSNPPSHNRDYDLPIIGIAIDVALYYQEAKLAVTNSSLRKSEDGPLRVSGHSRNAWIGPKTRSPKTRSPNRRTKKMIT